MINSYQISENVNFFNYYMCTHGLEMVYYVYYFNNDYYDDIIFKPMAY